MVLDMKKLLNNEISKAKTSIKTYEIGEVIIEKLPDISYEIRTPVINSSKELKT